MLRTDVKPLEISQPEGPSFTVEGNLVRWQKWQFRVGFHVRDGLIFHTIGYEDQGGFGPSCTVPRWPKWSCPMAIRPAAHFRRNAFDTGEYGVGQFLDLLTLGCDCLGHIHYFDAWGHDWHGNPKRIGNAICMHEEDYGILWKFTDTIRGDVRSSARGGWWSRAISTIGNYVYGFFWYFYQDGTHRHRGEGNRHSAGLGAGAGASPSIYGALVAPGIDAHVHQHVFCFRFDMCVDGDAIRFPRSILPRSPMGEGNVHGNAIAIIETPLRASARRSAIMDLAAARYWRVINPRCQ